ncbi:MULTISPECIES: zf-HC2 domain-containing protein [Comamonadaceae]|uniref:zf-HC2 domain-containing protein n=1 Tax=Comamonadaceae TaxID=80864 RepID=UPI00272CC784|nr:MULTISPECIES: zf-HC2 domain-containing protein [Comamonadaceae]MDP3886674.1 zf-HC2 domain-containing protein [Hydrogenophaga sp.]
MMNCQQATRLISESQDCTLSLSEKMALKMHVMMCAGCKNFSLQIPFLSQAMKAYAKGLDEAEKK